MTYYESAEGMEISRDRAMKELKDHSSYDFDNVKQFFRELGSHNNYEAQDVLQFLGY